MSARTSQAGAFALPGEAGDERSLAGIEEDDFVNEEDRGRARWGVDEEEDVIDEVAGGELGMGGAVVAAGVAREIEVGGAPLVLRQVAEDDVAVILDGGIEDLNGDLGGAGKVIAKAQFGVGADGPRGVDAQADRPRPGLGTLRAARQ